jgi:hypothetical protein
MKLSQERLLRTHGLTAAPGKPGGWNQRMKLSQERLLRTHGLTAAPGKPVEAIDAGDSSQRAQ